MKMRATIEYPFGPDLVRSAGSHKPAASRPQLLRRVPIRSERPSPWLLILGAALGAVETGLLALLFNEFRFWMVAPVFVGAVIGAMVSTTDN
ncbi:MAG: hypothetical protein JWP25_9016 [Bradyrhizobium sp.]|nr:hypothetical protein [Bradyrhizobium sp.]